MANIKQVSKIDYVIFVMDFPKFWDPSKGLKNEIREHMSVVCSCEDEDNCTCNDRLVCYMEVNVRQWYDTLVHKHFWGVLKIIDEKYDKYLIMQCSSVPEAIGLANILTKDPYEFCELTDLSFFEFIETEDKKIVLIGMGFFEVVVKRNR